MIQQRSLVIISQQLGGFDGVSQTAAEWQVIFEEMGFSVRRAAGFIHDSGQDDLVLPSLWRPLVDGQLQDPPPITTEELEAVTAAAGGTGGLALFENLGTLPSAPDSTVALVEHLTAHGVKIIFRHYDPSWEFFDRPSDPRFPLNCSEAEHVVVQRNHQEDLLARRQIHARLIRPHVSIGALRDGAEVCVAHGIDPDALVLMHPVTPYLRKDAPAAARFADELARRTDRPVVYWLTGGPDPLEGSDTAYQFKRGRFNDAVEMYSLADVVLLPSSWEGFGMPALEAGLLQLPVLTGSWPALDEMVDLGLAPVKTSAADPVGELLAQIEQGSRHDTASLARAYSRELVKEQLAQLLAGS